MKIEQNEIVWIVYRILYESESDKVVKVFKHYQNAKAFVKDKPPWTYLVVKWELDDKSDKEKTAIGRNA